MSFKEMRQSSGTGGHLSWCLARLLVERSALLGADLRGLLIRFFFSRRRIAMDTFRSWYDVDLVDKLWREEIASIRSSARN
jgi:hypothetical protein